LGFTIPSLRRVTIGCTGTSDGGGGSEITAVVGGGEGVGDDGGEVMGGSGIGVPLLEFGLDVLLIGPNSLVIEE
jgi:hypothetical protein